MNNLRLKVGGKFSFSNLTHEVQEDIKKRLAEKDETIKRGLSGEIPGLKIDGKQVTADNIHEFEIRKENLIEEKIVEKKEIVEEKVIDEPKEQKYTKNELEKLTFLELKEIAKTFGETGRSKKGIIEDILKHC